MGGRSEEVPDANFEEKKIGWEEVAEKPIARFETCIHTVDAQYFYNNG